MAKKQYLIVGLGRFGISLATTLCESGFEVMAVDSNANLVSEIQDKVTHAVRADMTDPDALSAIGVNHFDVAIVTIGTNLKASAVATMLLKEAGVRTVITKAHDETHGRLLTKLGADRVVYPERDMGRRLAHNLALGNILDTIEVSPDVSLVEFTPLTEWLNHSLAELNLPAQCDVTVVAIRTGEDLNVSMRGTTVIRPGDTLLVICHTDALRRLEKLAQRVESRRG